MCNWNVRSEAMQCLEERLTEEHLFYELQMEGPSLPPLLLSFCPSHFSGKGVINARGASLAINGLQSFKTTVLHFHWLFLPLVSTIQPTRDWPLPLRLFTYLTKYTNLPKLSNQYNQYLFHTYLCRVSNLESTYRKKGQDYKRNRKLFLCP